jgi:hypothetical protein
MSIVTGECLCGQITVSVAKEILHGTGKTCLCHCKNCRQAGGALASIVLVVPESDVKITGQPKVYQDRNTDSGVAIQRAFCSNCGSPIYTASPSMPGAKIIKLGLFDDIPKPSMEVFCRAIRSWEKPIDGANQFNTVPT